ncbi:MAG: hypothetical protein AAFQ57_04330 [Cyanobacteria bacterium J06626_14]
MVSDIWINLPVSDLKQSAAFFTKIGFSPNPGPGNTEQSLSFIISEKKVVLMIFVQDVFSNFTDHALSDTSKGSEVLFSLGADSREQVDEIANRVLSRRNSICRASGIK